MEQKADKERDKAEMIRMISTINQVEGFNPAALAVDYNDPANGMTYKRLPVMAQMAWFRLKYPEGRIAFSGIAEKVTPAGEPVYAVTARVYPDYRLGPECFLAEGTATRGYCREKPSVSPKEWAQTAAIGVALRNAGFGLQFQIAGEDFPEVAPDELGADAMNAPDPAGTHYGTQMPQETAAGHYRAPKGTEAGQYRAPQETEAGQYRMPQQVNRGQQQGYYQAPAPGPQMQQPVQPAKGNALNTVKELSYEEKVQRALGMSCPISKYRGYTLGQVIGIDPGALNWIATKSNFDNGIKEAARLLCEYALSQASA